VVKVGVIVPAYNARPWIEQTLASIQAQTYGKTFAYVADDLSTDGTWEFLTEHPELYTGLTRNEVKAGWHGGLNAAAALALADGCDAVFTACADDLLDPDCIALCVAEMIGRDRDFVIPFDQQFGAGDVLQVSHPDVTFDDLVIWPMMTDKALIRREVWEAVGGYSTDVTPPGTWGTAEDWEFWIKCWKAGLNSYSVIPRGLYFVRVHKGQLSNQRGNYHSQSVALFRAKHPDLPWTEDSGVWPPRHR
jgi:glycosyltransferase involved in cell wall biosynthesis